MAAALAASAFMAQAQVYSVNTVGYVNQEYPANTLVAVANPLNAETNDLNTVLAGVPNKSSAQFWNGAGFDLSTKSAAGWSLNAPIAPGTGFFVNSKAAYTNTYVGELAANAGETVTNALPAEVLVMVGSPLPYAGNMDDPVLGLNTVPNKSSAQFWNGAGYDLSTKSAAGWSGNPAIGVADGFFLNSKAAHDWVQTAPAN